MGHDHVTLVDRESNDEIIQAVQFLHENGENKMVLMCELCQYYGVCSAGIMLHFEDSNLSDYYFLSPQWLCDMLAHIVTIQATNVWISSDGTCLKTKADRQTQTDRQTQADRQTRAFLFLANSAC